MKRFISLALSLVLMLTLLPTAFAVSNEATEAAQTLYELGLFSGTGNNPDGTPNFDLDRAPTRQEAITMLVRLLGKEEEANAGTWDIPFTDVDNWAKPYVGYAYANGLTTGTGATTFGSNDIVTASQYLTFVLRALGYESGTDFQWDKAWEKSDGIGLTDGRYNAGTANFTRGDVAALSYQALSTTSKMAKQSLAETLGITLSGHTKNVLSIDNLQGVWQFENATSSGNPDDLFYEEFIFDGNHLTYATYSGSKRAGEFGISNVQENKGLSLDYRTGTFSVEGDSIIFDMDNVDSVSAWSSNNRQVMEYEVDSYPGFSAKYSVSNFTDNSFLCNVGGWHTGVCIKVPESTRAPYALKLLNDAKGIVSSSYSQTDKSKIATAMKTILEGQETINTAIQQALKADSMLLINSLSSTLSYSERLTTQQIMTQDCKIIQDVCFDSQSFVDEVINICNGKSNGDICIEKLNRLNAMFKKIDEWGTVTTHDELMEFAENVKDTASHAIEVSEWIYNNIMEK